MSRVYQSDTPGLLNQAYRLLHCEAGLDERKTLTYHVEDASISWTSGGLHPGKDHHDL